MSETYMGNYISSLHRQIYASVERIKRNSETPDAPITDKVDDKDTNPRSRIEEYAYKLLAEDISWSLQNDYTTSQEISYMNNSYRSAKNVLKKPTVLIDFMFKNNQEFDFKV